VHGGGNGARMLWRLAAWTSSRCCARMRHSLDVIDMTLSHGNDVTGAWLRKAVSLTCDHRLHAPSTLPLLRCAAVNPLPWTP
jgi:hypothetical protein